MQIAEVPLQPFPPFFNTVHAYQRQQQASNDVRLVLQSVIQLLDGWVLLDGLHDEIVSLCPDELQGESLIYDGTKVGHQHAAEEEDGGHDVGLARVLARDVQDVGDGLDLIESVLEYIRLEQREQGFEECIMFFVAVTV